jgi:hypothetical protein
MQLHENDRIRISVQNVSTIPVFVTVIRIGRDGVRPIFPRDANGGVDFRLDPSKDPSPIPGYVSRMTKPYGRDLYKVIATKDPSNFAGLLFRRRLPPGVDDKGQGEAKDKAEIAKLHREVRPLGLLLRSVADGRKGEEPELIGTEWATAEKFLEVLPPTGN